MGRALAIFLSFLLLAGGIPDAGSPGVGEYECVYKVGISQLVSHPALDAATQGFQDALNDRLPGQVTFIYRNAVGDVSACAAFADQFVADGVDLIMANSPPALQAAAAATTEIPILGTSVPEYGAALKIADFTGTVGGNISGTSDLAPLDQQAQMIKDWCPEAKNVGLVYCSAEPNSQYQVDVVKAELEKLGYACTQYPFADSKDMADVVQRACDSSDALYVPTDNIVATHTDIVDRICRGVKPVFAGETGICWGCGVAALSMSYYDIGYKTGEMAAQVLTGDTDIATMPIEYAPVCVPKYNPDTCAALGLAVPGGYESVFDD